MVPIKLMIADDHKILLDGLQRMLAEVHDIAIVSLAANGAEVVQNFSQQPVDVIMMDIQMPGKDGFETAAELITKFPDVRILVLSMHSERPYVEKMYRQGVMGYVLKTSGKDEIVEAIRTVAAGGKYFSEEVSQTMLGNKNVVSDGPGLTRRESEILHLIAAGNNNPEIAARLFLSVDTVKTHRKNLMRKLKINNTAGLVKYALSIVG